VERAKTKPGEPERRAERAAGVLKLGSRGAAYQTAVGGQKHTKAVLKPMGWKLRGRDEGESPEVLIFRCEARGKSFLPLVPSP
jgi:hypothetical protein